MKKKVFLTRTLHDFAIKELKKKYEIEIHSGKIPIPITKLRSKIKEVEGLICFPYDKVDKETLELAENLKVISTYSVGFDHIDLQCAKEMKIRVGYTPEVLTDATADLAIGLLLDISRRITEGDNIIRSKKWNQVFGAYDYVGNDLQGKTLGIFGFGRIGQTLAKRAKAFDMKIIYHSRRRVSKKIEKQLDAKYVSFEKMLAKSDVISIHVPHTNETEYVFSKKTLGKMKKTAFLINTARGKIIKEKDLEHALKNKTIRGAGLDVFETEPLSKKNGLMKLKNVVLAPHIGSSTEETRTEMAKIALQNLNRGINGKKPIFSVGY